MFTGKNDYLETLFCRKGNLSPMMLDIFKLLNLFRDKIGMEMILSLTILFSPVKDAFKLLYMILPNSKGSMLK